MKDAIPIVIGVVSDLLGIDAEEITAASDIAALGADQLEIWGIVCELENLLNIELPSDVEDALTVADIAASVAYALQAKDTAP